MSRLDSPASGKGGSIDGDMIGGGMGIRMRERERQTPRDGPRSANMLSYERSLPRRPPSDPMRFPPGNHRLPARD